MFYSRNVGIVDQQLRQEEFKYIEKYKVSYQQSRTQFTQNVFIPSQIRTSIKSEILVRFANAFQGCGPKCRA